MTPELRPHDVAPTRSHLALATFGCALGAGVLAVALIPGPPAPETATLAITEAPINVPMNVPVVASQDAPPPAPSSEIQLVFRAGGATYMQLSGLAELPRHGKARVVEDDYITAAIAPVADADLPTAARAWLGTEVTVDGTCTAKVTGFALIARLTGYPSYAGGSGEKWSPDQVMKNGAKLLAARLDNCAGGTYAREAALSAIVVPEVIDDPALAAEAERAWRTTPEVAAAQREWSTSGQPGVWWRNEYAEHQTQVLHHPKTGETWVSVFTHYDGGCGLPNVGVWALYRTGADGILERVPTSLGELIHIEKLIDIEGDGDLEVIGRPWLDVERTVQRASGRGIDTLQLPYYFCPC